MRYFIYPKNYWGHGATSDPKENKFLNLLQNNFMSQFEEDPAKSDALLNLVISNKAEHVNGSLHENLDKSGHNIISF